MPTETIQEHLEHHAHMSEEKWISWVALSTALLAAFAAIAALLAGEHINEGMIDQIRASDQWSFYQAKGIKAAVLGAKLDLLKSANQANAAGDAEKLSSYVNEQKEIEKEAREKQESAELHLCVHAMFARSVTMFQIAIAVAAISALTKRRAFWFVGLVFGAIGLALLIAALVPHHT